VASPNRRDPLPRLRRICLSFPEVTERLSHGAPSFFIRDKTTFVNAWIDGHHADRFPHLWCAAARGVQEPLIEAQPEKIFRPPYVGHRGWIGVRLDGQVDWDEVAELCEDAYRSVAPQRLIAVLDAGLR
jgi:hypothetical protein